VLGFRVVSRDRSIEKFNLPADSVGSWAVRVVHGMLSYDTIK
jgi:hypothetical protein